VKGPVWSYKHEPRQSPGAIPVVCTDRGTHQGRTLGRLTEGGVTFFDGIPQSHTWERRCPTCRRPVRWRPETARMLYRRLADAGISPVDISTL
jgi:hypothetical protein